MDTPPLDVEKFSHICIRVTDVERSLAFYRGLLGMDVVFDVALEGPSLEAVTGRGGAKGRMVGGLIGGQMVELIGFDDADLAPGKAAQLGYSNASWSVADLDEAYRRVGELGYHAEQEPVEIAGVRMFFVKDPDGTAIELIGYPGGARTSAELHRGRQD